jgi:hypothetical protein
VTVSLTAIVEEGPLGAVTVAIVVPVFQPGAIVLPIPERATVVPVLCRGTDLPILERSTVFAILPE